MSKPDYPNTFLEENEELISVIRRSPLMLAPMILFGGGLVIVNFFLMAWWLQWRSGGLVAFIVVLAVALSALIRSFYSWTRTILVVTNRRLIDVEQRGYFSHQVVEAPFEKIQNVTYVIKGVWSTLFKIGSIIIETAGQSQHLDLHGLRDPIKIQRLINDVQRRYQPPAGGQDLTAHELLRMVGKIKNELGDEKFQQLINRPGPH